MTQTAGSMKITSPTLHATILFTISVFVTMLVMSIIFKVEVVARGRGRIVPVSRVQIVQPEFQGRIVSIPVRNGMQVRQGDTLIAFDPTDALAALGTITAEQDRQIIEDARIDAMVKALTADIRATDFISHALANFHLPPALTKHPYTGDQLRLLEAEVAHLVSALAQTDAREETNRRSENVTNANVKRVEASLSIQAERLAMSRHLYQQGTTSRAVFLDVQQAFTEIEREREVYLHELDQKIAERAAIHAERRHIMADTKRKLIDRHTQIDARLATLAEEERSARRRLESATLKAPVSGTVDQLKIFTVGGVVKAGAELLRIVPTDVEIEFEATFANQDIGFMAAGQQVNIRLDTYPSERFGFVSGRITDLAADSTELSDGQWNYVVRVTPDFMYLPVGNNQFPLKPGMTATLDVTTDTRSLISYFFAPIIQTTQNALGER